MGQGLKLDRGSWVVDRGPESLDHADDAVRGRTAAECRAWRQTLAAKLGELLGPYRPPGFNRFGLVFTPIDFGAKLADKVGVE